MTKFNNKEISNFIKRIEEVNSKNPDMNDRAKATTGVWGTMPANVKGEILSSGLLDNVQVLRKLENVESDQNIKSQIDKRIHELIGDEYVGGPQGIGIRSNGPIA